MSVYRSGTLTYDPDKMNSAIVSAKKVLSNSDEMKNQMSVVKNSIPNNFQCGSISEANAALIKATEKLDQLSSILESMQNEIESAIEQEKIMTELVKANYAEEITLSNGQRGYLYIPKGYSSTAGLPLLVWLSGKGEMIDTKTLKRKGLPELLKNGEDVNGVVWVPAVKWNSHWCSDVAPVDIGNPYYDEMLERVGGKTANVYNTMVSCAELVDKLKLDDQRVSLFGYSAGAYGVGLYTTVCPDYFSTCATYGGASGYTPLKSSTTFIYLNESTSLIKEPMKAYEDNIRNGNQAVIYKINGAEHSDCTEVINQDLLNDIFNIRRGQKLSLPVGLQVAEKSDVVETSMLKNGSNKVQNNWYIPLVSSIGTVAISKDIEDLIELNVDIESEVIPTTIDIEKTPEVSVEPVATTIGITTPTKPTPTSTSTLGEETGKVPGLEEHETPKVTPKPPREETEPVTLTGGTLDSDKVSVSDMLNKDLSVKSKVTAEEITKYLEYKLGNRESFIRGRGDLFIKAANESGLDPLFLLGICAIESGWGQSNPWTRNNNFYGLKYYNGKLYASTEHVFSSVEEGIVGGAKYIADFYYTQHGFSTPLKISRGGYNGGNGDTYGTNIASIMADAYNYIQGIRPVQL